MASSDWLPADAPLKGRALDAWRAYRDAVVEHRRHAKHPTYQEFLRRVRLRPAEEGEAFCRWLCVWAFERGRCDPAWPLVRDLLLPYLVGGIVRGPATPYARWLAVLHVRSRAYVEPLGLDLRTLARAAVVADPHDRQAWRMVFDDLLDEAAWGAHHMDEDLLVLPLEQCLRALAEARDPRRPAARLAGRARGRRPRDLRPGLRRVAGVGARGTAGPVLRVDRPAPGVDAGAVAVTCAKFDACRISASASSISRRSPRDRPGRRRCATASTSPSSPTAWATTATGSPSTTAASRSPARRPRS